MLVQILDDNLSIVQEFDCSTWKIYASMDNLVYGVYVTFNCQFNCQFTANVFSAVIRSITENGKCHLILTNNRGDRVVVADVKFSSNERNIDSSDTYTVRLLYKKYSYCSCFIRDTDCIEILKEIIKICNKGDELYSEMIANKSKKSKREQSIKTMIDNILGEIE